MSQSRIILFDGICNLCCGWVQFIIKHDSKAKFSFASIQSESGKRILNTLGINPENPETIIFIKDNRSFVESDAVLSILRELDGIWSAFYGFILIPKSIRNFIYRFIAKRRYRLFGKRNICLLPDEKHQKRFIETF